MTSVKEVRVVDNPTPTDLGKGSFFFTDDYSVFDWGVMPDQIPEKGAVLCTMGASNFEGLEANGIATHYRGVRTDDGVTDLESTRAPPREMVIDITQVPDLPFDDGEYDYVAYHDDAGENYLIPLEIVFRNVIPVGSSLRSRIDPSDLGFSFSSWPDRPVSLDDPIVEFSTKYEEQDRYLSEPEAAQLAGNAPLDDLRRVALDVNRIITDRAAATGLVHQDGKIECLYYAGEVRVADVAGTFDENRFAYDGQQLSKEVLRQYYKQEHPAWVAAVDEAKTTATQQGIADWRTLCEIQPPSLPPDAITVARDLYTAGANTYLDRPEFDAPALPTAIGAVRELLS